MRSCENEVIAVYFCPINLPISDPCIGVVDLSPWFFMGILRVHKTRPKNAKFDQNLRKRLAVSNDNTKAGEDDFILMSIIKYLKIE